MTDQPTSPAGDHPQTILTRRSLRHAASLPQTAIVTPPPRRARVEAHSRRRSHALRPIRSLAVLTMVTGMVATVALPAYAAGQPAEAEISTLQQVASDDAQSLVVASDSAARQLSRESYAATTQAEIDEKKAAASAAAARARGSARVASAPFDYSMVTPGSGTVRWPVGGPFTVTDRFGARGGAHMGTDMVAAGGTPVYASVDGVVRISQDRYSAYGVTVVVESVLNGQQVRTVYPHMQTGSRQVVVGQSVAAGQLVGLIGSTGRSTANHLHFEVYLDGIAVDSLAWLQANAG
ncbi:M23 family metallopeptidase [Planococcus sp. APC 4015]|jgi:murein DD-endopeptidase MepM/ murein hydrolase activator NlpD|nr:M23 family metallopeptidase [Planococcus sp. APC 4015]